jgi:hypothetical protein
MRSLTHRRSRTALTAGGITLLAALVAGVMPAEAAAVPAGLRSTAAGPSAAGDTTGPGARAGLQRTGSADATAGLEAIKARSATQIARRQAALAARLTLVTSGSPMLTPADREALISLIKNDQAGLAALGTKIAADTDLATAKADHQQIFTGYRVYALALPQVRLVRANDALIGAALPRLTDAQTRLESALAKAGKTDEATAKMADLQVQIDIIESNTSGLSGRVLALTPAQWNADHTILSPARQSLLACRAALRTARADIVAVRALLRS